MISLCKTPPLLHSLINPTSSFLHPSSPLLLSFHFHSNPSTLHPRLSSLKAAAAAAASDADNLLGKPLLQQQQQQQHDDDDNDILPIKTTTAYAFEEVEVEEDEDEDGAEEERWVDWEDQILEDTVPLVGFVRMILHSGKYESGERLSPEHEKAILEKLLPFHPEHEKKIGCGIDYITIGYHPNFDRSRCLFIVRKDGELVDFSYWKCIKGLIRKNYPLYADTFILRHFRKRSPSL